MLQRESTSDKDTSDSADLWENWKEQEQRNRFVLMITTTKSY
jgi:hypothetical protein